MGIGEHFEGVKQHWASNFAFLDYFKKVYGRAEPLPKWSDADVDEFIASDPVYGPQMRFPQLKALRESRKFALAGALVGAAHLGGVALKYSKAPHGVLLATGFGAITGAVLGSEVADHWYQLYEMDKQGANLRFIYWWEDKVSGLFRSLCHLLLLKLWITMLKANFT
ncbi:Succinate dehydrogenase subunit 6 mitochondrial [Zea mays]|uniref:Succinate dehydrogenase subunit 6 mitochondrial n=1 Tax=Zea mays TaxID=4577 RepID=A0A1D6LE51_MAIZE|nr:Succinate dehydrogenase subunit 6 mitochondrial [Zea mays]AQK78249.1 Succinate dehydrogenase subunit 6 mitochondrial [Zea mays]